MSSIDLSVCGCVCMCVCVCVWCMCMCVCVCEYAGDWWNTPNNRRPCISNFSLTLRDPLPSSGGHPMSWTAAFSLHALWIPHQLAGAAGWRRVEGASVLLLSTVRSIIVYYWSFESPIVSSINCTKCNYQISSTLDHSNAYLYIVSQWLAVHTFLQVLFSLHSAEVLLQMSINFTIQTQSIICS